MTMTKLPWTDRFIDRVTGIFEHRSPDSDFIIRPGVRPVRVANEWYARLNHFYPVGHPSEESLQTLIVRHRGIRYVYFAARLAQKFASIPEGVEWERRNGFSPWSLVFVLGLLLQDDWILKPLLAAMEKGGDTSLEYRYMAEWSRSYWQTDENLLMRAQFGIGFQALCFSRTMPLLAAVATDDAKQVRDLLASGENPNVQDPQLDLSPLVLSATCHDEEILRLLLAAGTKTDVITRSMKTTPLHVATTASERHKTALRVRMLLDAGADPNAKDALGRTPLHMSASLKSEGLVTKLLLAAGADVDSRDDSGNAPMHIAARSYAIVPLGLLIDAGGDPNARDAQGMTPLHLVALSDPNNMVDGNIKSSAIKALVAGGADIGATDSEGRTPLHCAADNLDPWAVRALVESRSKRDTVDNLGRTPKDLAESDKPLSFHGMDFKSRKSDVLTHLCAIRSDSSIPAATFSC